MRLRENSFSVLFWSLVILLVFDPESLRSEVEACYAKKKIDDDTVKNDLIDRIRGDSAFAKRCLLLLCEDSLMRDDLVALYGMLNHVSD